MSKSTFKDRVKVDTLFPNTEPLAPGDCIVLEELTTFKVDWNTFISQRVVEEADRTVRKVSWPLTGAYGEEWHLSFYSVRRNGQKEPCLRVTLEIEDRATGDTCYQLQMGLALQNSVTGAIFSRTKEFDVEGFYQFGEFVPLDEDDLPDPALIDKNGWSDLHFYLSVSTSASNVHPLVQTSAKTWEMSKSSLGIQFSEFVDIEDTRMRIAYFDYYAEAPTLVIERDGAGEDNLSLQVELFATGHGPPHRSKIISYFKHHDQKGFSEPDLVNCTSFGFTIL